MWFRKLLSFIPARKPAGKQTDFEMTKEALKPTRSRPLPPKPLTAPPKIEKRAR